MKTYYPNDILNLDETAVHYKMLPDKMLAFKNDVCTGEKHSKMWLTVMTATIMWGTEKCHLLILGKAYEAISCCTKEINTFQVDNTVNCKAWMTGKLLRTGHEAGSKV